MYIRNLRIYVRNLRMYIRKLRFYFVRLAAQVYVPCPAGLQGMWGCHKPDVVCGCLWGEKKCGIP